jgi:hypothetical protein
VKWLALLFALGAGVPWLAGKAAESAKVRRWIAGLIAFELFNPEHINLISEETYRGDSRGIEITTVDLLVLALHVAQRRRGITAPSGRRFLIPRILYFLAYLASLSASPNIQRSLYSVWKLTRMYFAFSVLATAFLELELVQASLQGLAVGVVSQGLLALQQKYLHHAVRVTGSQSHPNSLAMLVNFIAPVAFSLLLSGAGTRITLAVFALAGACDVFSLSRGGMMMFALGSVLVAIASLTRGVTARKTKILAALGAGGVVAIAWSAKTIIQRFTNAPKESELARKLFNLAAHAMADDHPFGIGVNMYSYVLSHAGYADRFHIDPGDRDGIAHHIYWLTAAETGYVGLATYLILLVTVYVAGVRAALGKGLRAEIAVGIVVGLTTTYMQGTAEWIGRQTTMAYCFWMFAAMISAFRVREAIRH